MFTFANTKKEDTMTPTMQRFNINGKQKRLAWMDGERLVAELIYKHTHSVSGHIHLPEHSLEIKQSPWTGKTKIKRNGLQVGGIRYKNWQADQAISLEDELMKTHEYLLHSTNIWGSIFELAELQADGKSKAPPIAELRPKIDWTGLSYGVEITLYAERVPFGSDVRELIMLAVHGVRTRQMSYSGMG